MKDLTIYLLIGIGMTLLLVIQILISVYLIVSASQI